MNLPATLNPSKGAAKIDRAADLIIEASKLLDAGAKDLIGTDFDGRLDAVPEQSAINIALAKQLKALSASIFETEGF